MDEARDFELVPLGETGFTGGLIAVAASGTALIDHPQAAGMALEVVDS